MRGDEIEGRAWRPVPSHGGGVLAAGEAAVTGSSATDDEGACAGESGSRRSGILLDRDGTIIVDSGYVGSVDRVEFIAGAAGAIARFNQAGIPVAVVTNQAGGGPGGCRAPEGAPRAFARASDDRKPNPGMARAAPAALHRDLTASWVVGDRPEDMGLAAAIGASAVYLGPEPQERPNTWSFPSLATAAPFILERVTT